MAAADTRLAWLEQLWVRRLSVEQSQTLTAATIIILVMMRGVISLATPRAQAPVTNKFQPRKTIMRKHKLLTLGMAGAICMATSMMMTPVSATEHQENNEHNASQHRISPLPGMKHCLHHIAQHDAEGNFVGYKTVKGPCN
jgi:hypothetical protein